MKRWFVPVLFLILLALILTFIYFPISGEHILKKIPIANADQITIQKTSEHAAETIHIASCTISDEMAQNFIRHFGDTTFQNLYSRSFYIESEIRYHVSIVTSDDTVQISMKFYDDDAVLIDCTYGDEPAFHGRYGIVKTDLVDFFDDMLQE